MKLGNKSSIFYYYFFIIFFNLLSTEDTIGTCEGDAVPSRQPSKHGTFDVVFMLGQRRRRWANIKTTLVKRMVFTGYGCPGVIPYLHGKRNRW